ncbi:hypothetical protein [Scandinavium goeteborgense]|uniref:Uncharacterized protein n=1 Tax=Scandinavium goeteborgense TaxID=1851514 RepID=A0A4R6ELZ9_SCAGO|nr:hypothetical protein [Scandinavium goeteborgense]TDN60014.1 hypothetical protein EC847_103195 [Scandinavium goeteborgense]
MKAFLRRWAKHECIDFMMTYGANFIVLIIAVVIASYIENAITAISIIGAIAVVVNAVALYIHIRMK